MRSADKKKREKELVIKLFIQIIMIILEEQKRESRIERIKFCNTIIL